jgi:hypothetical protein
VRSAVFAAVAVIACVVWAVPASASPVATSDSSYSLLGRVFPDPMAGCQQAGTAPCDPNAEGDVPATQFIGIDEFMNAVHYMNSKKPWQRYMEVWALDGKFGNGSGKTSKSEDPGNNRPLEFDPKASYLSAGIPTTSLGRHKSDLMVVRVTDESVPDKGKKRYAISLSIHGIERAGAEGGTRAMEDLVTAATTGRSNKPIVGSNVIKGAPTVAQVLRKTIIYFTYPNPDGWRRGSVSSGANGGVFFQRYNGNGVDPNRDWPDVGYSFRPYSSVSEPETRAWIAFYRSVKSKTHSKFAAGDDLHGQLEADALSYTLLPHGRHKLPKNNRIQETAKRINRATYQAIKWSPIVQPNSAPQGGGVPCVPPTVGGDTCAKIYGQTWGTVFDTINYTTTGALGDWFDSSIGLKADGIDNEMSFSHLDKNIVFEPQTEQLHVEGNKALIFAHLSQLVKPRYGRTFGARGRKGYVPNRRLKRGSSTAFPKAPPGTHPQSTIDATLPAPGTATENFSVQRTSKVYSGGMRVEVTNGNVSGIGTGNVTLQIQCKGCDRHPGVKDSSGYITVAEDFNQSPLYLQAGVVATVNDPQAYTHGGKPVKWRAVVNGPSGVVHFHIVFTKGPASTSGDTGGGPPPHQRGYNVANTDFFKDLNPYMPGRKQDFRVISPRRVIAGRQSLASFDTIALADNPLPGYTGLYGRKTPKGGPTKAVSFTNSGVTTPSQGSGNPASFDEHTFTIGPNDGDASATIGIDWDLPTDDWDLTVFHVVHGQRVVVGRSAGGPPGTSESVRLLQPDPGKYVVQAENYASANPSYRGSVKFGRLKRHGTGAYTDGQRVIWMRKLRAWVKGGGNLVLTDGALRALRDLTPLPTSAINRIDVYAGQSSFATDDTHPTTSDKLARGVVQQGARFGSGMRRQMFEPTPLGFAIQDADGNDKAASPQWDIDKDAWQTVGGRTVATSINSDPSAAASVYDRVTIGELRIGDGQIRVAGALLPQPTERFDHEYGLEDYATTYTGYIIARNLLDAGRVRKTKPRPPRPEVGKATLGGRFVISRRLVKLRHKKIVRVHVKCRGRGGCRGLLRLRVRRGGKLVGIGRKHFHFRHRRSDAVIHVTLNQFGRSLIAAERRIHVRAVARVRFGDGTGGTARRRFFLERAAHPPHQG